MQRDRSTRARDRAGAPIPPAAIAAVTEALLGQQLDAAAALDVEHAREDARDLILSARRLGRRQRQRDAELRDGLAAVLDRRAAA